MNDMPQHNAPAEPSADPDHIPMEGFLPHMSRAEFGHGDVLFRKGDRADRMFYIEEGAIELTEIGKTLGRGEVIGEMGVFCPTNERTVSAVCRDDLVVRTIDRDGLLAMLDRDPHLVFSLLQLAIGRFAENLRRQTAARERIESELRVARDIQSSSLPGTFPAFPERAEFDLFAAMDPAKEVGGDFYDFLFTGPDTLFLAVGDVSGKGVPAALFMMTVKTLLRSEARRGLPPEEVLRNVNELVLPDNSSFMFVTVLCAALNVRTGEVLLGSAGHNPPVVCRTDRAPEEIDIEGSPVLGVGEHPAFASKRLRLAPGDTLFLYTDGVVEAADPADEFYSEARLLRTLSELRDLGMSELVGGVREDVRSFANGAPQFDDITMLALRRTGPDEPRALACMAVPAELDSLGEVREAVTACARQRGLPEERIGDLELAVEEALANIANYAYPDTDGAIHIECFADDRGFVVRFTDEGVPFDALALPEPELGADLSSRKVGGLGVYLLRQVMDNVDYRREAGRNVLSLTVHAPGDDAGPEQ